MSVISCPRCDETVRVPEAVSTASAARDGSVRCPWCRETFSASEVIGRLPPLLEVVSLDGDVLDGDVLDGDVLDGDSFDDPGFGSAEVQEYPSNEPQPAFDEYQLSDPIQNAGPSIPPVTRPAGASRGRSGSRNGSGIGAVIKMALGGLMAVPIAATILSLVGKPLPIDLGFFPFQGDATENRSSRVVAEPSRRASTPRVLSDPRTHKPPKSRVLTPAGGEAMDDAASPGDSAPDGSAMDRESTSKPVAEEPTAAENALAEIQDAVVGLGMPDLPAGSLGPESELGAELESGLDSLVEPFVELGVQGNVEPAVAVSDASLTEPVDSAATRSPELSEAIAGAGSAVEKAVDLYEVGAVYKLAFQDAYRKIAEVAAMLDEGSVGDESVKTLMQMVVASSELQEKYSDVGPRWPGFSGRKTDGILLIGESKESDGETKIDFGNGKSLTVRFGSKLPKGRVVAMGRIEEAGDEGTDAKETVIELFAVESVQ